MDHKDLMSQSADNFNSANKIEKPQVTELNGSSFDLQNILQRYDSFKILNSFYYLFFSSFLGNILN